MRRLVLCMGPLLFASALMRAEGQTDSAASIARREIGHRIRARGGSGEIDGMLRDVRAESLFVDVRSGGRETRGISAASLTRLDVREPLTRSQRTHRELLGLAAGVLLGAGTGSVLAVPAVHHIMSAPNHDGPFEGLDYLTFPLVGAFVGGIVGIKVGSLRGEGWVVRFEIAR